MERFNTVECSWLAASGLGQQATMRDTWEKWESHSRFRLPGYLSAIHDSFPEGIRITSPAGGFSLWIELSASVDALQYLAVLELGIGICLCFFGAFSRYPFQSFLPNPGTKGFPLLSRLGKLKPFLVAAILIKAFFFFFELFISLFLLGNINSIANERYN